MAGLTPMNFSDFRDKKGDSPSDGVSHMRLRNKKKMCADSSAWGSDNKDKHWSATDTSCAT